MRLKLLDYLVVLVSNNLLEFIAEIVCIWLDMLEDKMDLDNCCLALGDNASAVGWIYKSNFCNETQIQRKEVAYHLASLCIDYDVCICAQHFKGE